MHPRTDTATAPLPPAAPSPAPSRLTGLRLPAGWPIAALVAGYPLWWATGLGDLVLPLVAVPLAWELARSGRIRVPPGFWCWLLFLLTVAVSVVAMDLSPEGTLPPSGAGRYLAFAARLAMYVAVAVVMLYIGNASEEALPRLRVVRWMGLLAIWLVLLGLLALLMPSFSFSTLAGGVLPGASDTAVLAQVQPVLGYESPRPAAPFAYTNIWGDVLSLTGVWLVVGWVLDDSLRRRALGGLVLLAACVPLVYSLNRGVWLGVGLSVAYVAVRLALRGRAAAIAGLCAAVLLGGAALASSPLAPLVEQRADAGHSDGIRTTLALDAVDAALESPVIGFGSTRATQGSGSSIAVGKSADCPQCGNRNIGSTGQLWLLLISQGFVGTALFYAFFVRSLWAARRDTTAIGLAGTLVVLLGLFYSTLYVANGMPLLLAFMSVALLWRNSRPASAGDSTRALLAPGAVVR